MNEKIPSIPDKGAAAENAEPQDELSFAVDLNREEFIRFNLLNLRLNGLMRFRKGLLAVLGVLGVMNVLVLILDARSGSVDPVMVALLALLLLIGAGYLLGFPPMYAVLPAKRMTAAGPAAMNTTGWSRFTPTASRKRAPGRCPGYPSGRPSTSKPPI